MVVVPEGWFWMGQDDGRRSNQPRRQVYLDAFEIDRAEVTNAAFELFVSETGFVTKGWRQEAVAGKENEPVMGVLWEEADAYCRWAGKRLPTEAEWEKAARGTDGRRYPWGDEWNPALANTAEMSIGGVKVVGSFPEGASPYRVLDMAGNAAEWVADYYDPDYYQFSPLRNPPGPERVMDHVLRGGSWDSPRAHAQTFFRDSSHSVRPNLRVGFRCVKDMP